MSNAAVVSCRAIADGLGIAEEQGVDLTGIAEGTPYTLEEFRDPTQHVSWTHFVVVTSRLCERLGGLDGYEKLGADLAHHPKATNIRRFMRIASGPLRAYSLSYRWMGPLMYPFVDTGLEVSGHTVRIRIEIPSHMEGSTPFLRAAVGVARTIPCIYGLPDAHVDFTIDPHRLDMTVRVPNKVPITRRATNWLRMMYDAPSVVAELVDHQQQLQASFLALQTSNEALRVRELLLADEIEAREAAQAELARRNEQLLHAQRMESLGRMAGGVAHDFNNVLTAIRAQADLLYLESDDARVKASLGGIRASVDRAAGLTHQLLTFARSQPVSLQRVDAGESLRDLLGMLQRAAPGAEVLLELAAEPMPIRTDPVRFEQVMLNLAVNAADAMPDGGSMTVSARRAGAMVRISVTDTGTGIPSDVIDRIFEPFYTTKGKHGTGLGLATAYGIVTDARGTLSVQSEVGSGTTFVVDWPAASTTKDATPHAPLRTLDSEPPTSCVVLIIEDEEDIRTLLAAALRHAGHHVHTACDRATALAHRTQALDLVVSDVMLGADRGPAVVRALREDHPDLPALFISGFTDPSAMADLPGGSAFLAKPFSIQDLLDRVQTLTTAG